MKIGVLIIDDEPYARKRIRRLLEEDTTITILGECKNAYEAEKEIAVKKPDIIFLDVKMPQKLGTEIIVNEKNNTPYIIFTTAYSEYTLEAFDAGAIDYLLKPFSEERFAKALERAKEALRLKTSYNINESLKRMLLKQKAESNAIEKNYELVYNGTTVNISEEELFSVEAEGNYVNLCLENKNYLYRSSISKMEEELSTDLFLRIHRSTLVNIRYIKTVKYANNNEYNIALTNSKKYKSGRFYKEKIEEFLSKFNY